jgi:molybdopterin converting factor subunit 1
MKVLYFASIKQLLGLPEEEIEIKDGSYTYDCVMNILLERHQEKASKLQEICAKSLIAKNDDYLDRSAKIDLRNSDTISIIPPISGG